MKNSQCHDIQSVMIAADGRPDRRRQRRDEPDDRADDVEFRARKHRVGRREHGRDHAGAEKSLDRAPDDHLLDGRGEAAEEARDGEAGGGDRKQQPRAERARHEARTAESRSPRRSNRRSAPTRLRWSSPKARPGFRTSDAETIWMSRIDMNIPNTMMRNANSRRGGIRSAGASRGVHHRWRCGGGVGHDLLGSAPDLRRRQTISDGSLPANRDRPRCRHPARPRGCRRWCRPTCRRAAGFASPRPSARGCAPAGAARSW